MILLLPFIRDISCDNCDQFVFGICHTGLLLEVDLFSFSNREMMSCPFCGNYTNYPTFLAGGVFPRKNSFYQSIRIPDICLDVSSLTLVEDANNYRQYSFPPSC